MSSICVCLFAFMATLSFPADAGGDTSQDTQQTIDKESLKSTLLTELSNSHGTGAEMVRFTQIKDSLRPMFKAVQPAGGGTLSHPLVRYMLHRHFVQRYGWFIRGLEPNGGGQKNGEWVPSYLQDLLEHIQGHEGVHLRQLTVLAATIESLIHQESVRRLEKTFRALELPVTTLLDEAQLGQVLEVYMMIYMLSETFVVQGAEEVLALHNAFIKGFETWPAIQEWMHTIQLEFVPAGSSDRVNFTTATLIVEQIAKQYGAYDSNQCSRLKEDLLDTESPKAGRIRLPEFYKKSLSGVFEFNEKIEYLRAIGTLDESNASDPLVVVPNYVASRANCVVGSTFYAVCCRNECENLLAAFEKEFKAPTATPDVILRFLRTIANGADQPTFTSSYLLVQRLELIAHGHGGQVPLHGRLFALWMHHAFPRTCPFPQKAAATNPQTPDEWMVATGNEVAKTTREEMQVIVNKDGALNYAKGPEAENVQHLYKNDLPWDQAEELPYVAGERTKKADMRKTPKQATRIPPPWTSFRVTTRMLTFAPFIVGLAICAWKVSEVAATVQEENKQQRVSMIHMLADKFFSQSGPATNQDPAHYV